MSEKKVILHIDDDARVRDAVGEVLAMAGYISVGVANGLDALEHVATYGAPALVLVDLTMPVMDGKQFLAERRKWASLAHVPFVALTASGAFDAAELGVAEVLRKPVDIDRLLAVARRYAPGRSGTYSAVTPKTPRVTRKNER
jgi:two-component system, OmpR family, response regulator